MVNIKIKDKFFFRIYETQLLQNIIKYQIQKKSTPFPTVFQIQLINQCNGSCIMCPNIYIKGKTEFMADSLFEKIISEILKKSKSPTIILELQNEPLLDNELFRKIKYINKTFALF